MNYSADDHRYMQRALRLAAAATRRAAPNPGVGCVLVRDGEVIGEGATLQVGGDHAEIQAIKDCLARGLSPRGAVAYVTLEPCSHHGRTPPCARRLIDEGVARVAAAMVDPYHEVAGRGLAMLRAAGVDADAGLMEAEARQAHRGFLSRVERGRPWVTLKAAATLDGKTALLNGRSQWITGPEARRDVHRLRAEHCAVLTGSGTVLADDPQLTVREVPCERQPLRVVLDSGLRTAPEQRIYQGGSTLLATCDHPEARLRPYRAGAEILTLPRQADGHADLPGLLAALAQRGVNMLMAEAGAGLNGALLRAGLVDEIVLYLAPSLAGDAARGLFAWPALEDLADKQRLSIRDARMVGADLRLSLTPI
ncbi:diaminohydroxyphosphoribosylaminopyrimidine deaminase [Chromobacterium sp. LK11]|uniref:bifunctional diaminohydroxyphosphoribosylaminopyrimidine deaminase/5-amino-6-(5-phosphoribosylamino)uracil reductase RibD n=1 Tax=Chromobacterium sp. LK11 TaxID=1628212 RepID=UPI000652F784|nr:bifunctional diaminohydroxyphosphoribosylaminopyrimidine deaminase/5-amino-6-(5-phosphoribosylamino)uracil reductase RibD [Chromobacterium sp. LK11]KMN83537.1 diaminohydroxyphosphoribosylaminopyrimidine deaminase [Chromobacterium sp. LK11]